VSDLVTVRTTIKPNTPERVTLHERECLRSLGLLVDDPQDAETGAQDGQDGDEPPTGDGEAQDPPTAAETATTSTPRRKARTAG
jgi:hypothetical protein